MKTTTLNEIKKHYPCQEGWRKLLSSLNKTKADDEPLSFNQILESNGIEDAVWSLRVLPFKEQALFRADLAESALHIFESNHPYDNRPRKAIEALRKFAAGAVDAADAADARAAAYVAAREAKWQEIERLFVKHFC